MQQQKEQNYSRVHLTLLINKEMVNLYFISYKINEVAFLGIIDENSQKAVHIFQNFLFKSLI